MGKITDYINNLISNSDKGYTPKEILTEKVAQGFLAQIEEISKRRDLSDEEKLTMQKALVMKLSERVQNGDVDFGDTKEKSPLDLIADYYKNSSIGKTVGKIVLTEQKRELVDKVLLELGKENPNIEEIESMIESFEEKAYAGKQMSKYKDLSLRKRHIKTVEYINGKQIEIDTPDEVYGKLYDGYLSIGINQVKQAKTDTEKARLYGEYVDEFLDGEIDEDDLFIQEFKDAEFLKTAKRIELCEKYGIDVGETPIKIFEAFPENESTVDKENEKRAIERMHTPASAKDLILVRTTNLFPDHGIVETQDKHSTPMMSDSIFKDELEKMGINPDEYQMATYRNRRTTHWSLNGLVGNHHLKGDFSSRDFIILEPLDEHLSPEENMLSISERDTYYASDMKMSKRATILMPLDRYKEYIKDPKWKKKLEDFDVELFAGDERLAVEMALQDKGYVFGEIGMWGFTMDRETPVDRYGGNLIEGMWEVADKMGAEKGLSHPNSETRRMDLERESELENEMLSLYCKYLKEVTQVPFSEKYLKEYLEAQKYYMKPGHVELEDETVKPMTPGEILKQAGPGKILEATKRYNAAIMQEHKKERAKKLKEFAEKGYISEEELDLEEK